MNILEKINELDNELKVRGTAYIAKTFPASMHATELAGAYGLEFNEDQLTDEQLYDLYVYTADLTTEVMNKGIKLILDEIKNSREVDSNEITESFDTVQQMFASLALNAAAYATYLERTGKLVIDSGDKK